MARRVTVVAMFEVLFVFFLPVCVYSFLHLIPWNKIFTDAKEGNPSRYTFPFIDSVLAWVIGIVNLCFVGWTHGQPGGVRKGLSRIGSFGVFVIWFFNYMITCLMSRHAILIMAATTLNGALVCFIGIFFDRDGSGIISSSIMSSAVTFTLATFPKFSLGQFILGVFVFVLTLVYQITSLDDNSRIRSAFFTMLGAIKSFFSVVNEREDNEPPQVREDARVVGQPSGFQSGVTSRTSSTTHLGSGTSSRSSSHTNFVSVTDSPVEPPA